MKAHAFGCAGDRACSCCSGGSSGSSGSSAAWEGAGLGASGLDPLSMLLDTGASALPLPPPLRDAAGDALRAGVSSLAQDAQQAAQQVEEQARAQAAAARGAVQNAAAKVRPRLQIPKKKGMKRSTKVALVVTGGLLVGAGVAAKVLL